jgi:hypothetical protein
VHPGIVETGLSKPMRDAHVLVRLFEATVKPFVGATVQQGVLNQLWAATSKEIKPGEYYVPVGKKAGSVASRDVEMAKKLWDWTEKELRAYTL